jgi:co-chaperonin GroES (HSP10)
LQQLEKPIVKNQHGHLRVFHERCLVKPPKIEEVSKGGIIIPLMGRKLDTYELHKVRFIAAGTGAFRENEGARPEPGAMVWCALDNAVTYQGADGEDYAFVHDKAIFSEVDESVTIETMLRANPQRDFIP